MSNKMNFRGRLYSGKKRGISRGPVRHGGRAHQRTSRGVSNGFRGAMRQRDGEPVAHYGSPTKRFPWTLRQERRAAAKVARASRKANRG